MLALNAGKDYLLAEVGVFWVLVRVLACGALAVMVWLVTSGHLQTKRFTEVRPSIAFRVQQSERRDSGRWWACRHCCSSCGTQDCSRHSIDSLPLGMFPAFQVRARPTYGTHSVILFIHFSPIWFKSLTGLTSVSACAMASTMAIGRP